LIFVNSMSDLFHKLVPFEFVDRVFDTMELANWHTLQVLTKRSSRMRDYVRARYENSVAPIHIWLGVSVEDGSKLSRVRLLRQTPVPIRFLSVEPLIGAVGELPLEGIGWVIVGGESDPKARPLNPQWVRDIRNQCVARKVPFFFKQWGGLRPKSGGRTLDGREWSEWPTTTSFAPVGGIGSVRTGGAPRTWHGSAEDDRLEA
jgi:protein gp37